jgi:hypothetical protein
MPTSALILAEISNQERSPLHSERLHHLRLQMCPGVLLPSYLRLEDFIAENVSIEHTRDFDMDLICVIVDQRPYESV